MQPITPTFNLMDWELTRETADQLVFRPGGRVLFRRGLFAAVMVAIAALGYYGGLFALRPWLGPEGGRATLTKTTEGILTQRPATVSEAEWDRAVEHSRTRVAQREQHLQLQGARMARVLRVSFVLFAALMLLLPASVFWNHVILEITPKRELQIHRWLVLPRSYTLPLAALKGARFGAQEILHRTTKGMITDQYWRWFIHLQHGSPDGTAVAAVLYPCKQPGSPGQSKPPARVAALLRWLGAHAPLQVSGPTFLGASHARGRRMTVGETPGSFSFSLGRGDYPAAAVSEKGPAHVATHVSHRVETVDQHGARRCYDSLDAVPESIRKHLPPIDAMPAGETVSHRIVIRDADGTERHYTSPEELPPELRARFEAARNRLNKG